MPLADFPYIQVVFDQVRPYADKIHMEIIYRCVRLIIPGEKLFEYSSGDYQKDIALAREDGKLRNNTQERNVALYEELEAAKPEERDAILAKHQTTSPLN
jgi:hypothetical protein